MIFNRNLVLLVICIAAATRSQLIGQGLNDLLGNDNLLGDHLINTDLFGSLNIGQYEEMTLRSRGLLDGNLLGGNLLGLGSILSYPLGVNGSLLSVGTILNPITATANIAVNAIGTYTVSLTQNLVVNTLTLGSSTGNAIPTLNVLSGVTLILNGGLTILSGSINLAPGATLIVNGVGLTVQGVLPVVINVAAGATITVNKLLVGLPTSLLGLKRDNEEARQLGQLLGLGAPINSALTIAGAGNLNLVGTVVNVAADVVINLPITLTVASVINTVAGATVVLNSVVNVVGNVVLGANINLGSAATLILAGVNGGLTVPTATIASGATIVVNLLGSVGSVLKVNGLLNVGANVNLVVNALGSVTSNIPIISYGTLNGVLTLATGLPFTLTATVNSLVAVVLNVVGSVL